MVGALRSQAGGAAENISVKTSSCACVPLRDRRTPWLASRFQPMVEQHSRSAFTTAVTRSAAPASNVTTSFSASRYREVTLGMSPRSSGRPLVGDRARRRASQELRAVLVHALAYLGTG